MIALPPWNHSLRLNLLLQTQQHHLAILLLNKADLTYFDQSAGRQEVESSREGNSGEQRKSQRQLCQTAEREMLQFQEPLGLHYSQAEEWVQPGLPPAAASRRAAVLLAKTQPSKSRAYNHNNLCLGCVTPLAGHSCFTLPLFCPHSLYHRPIVCWLNPQPTRHSSLSSKGEWINTEFSV